MIALGSETTATKAWAELNRVFGAAGLETPVSDARLLVCAIASALTAWDC